MLRTVSLALSTIALMAIGTAANADEFFAKKGWPVVEESAGIYVFDATGKSKATAICTAYYQADIEEAMKFDTSNSGLGLVMLDHSKHMHKVFKTRYTGDMAEMDQTVQDIRYLQASAAEHKKFQLFKDSANAACESYALENNVVTWEYMESFFARLSP